MIEAYFVVAALAFALVLLVALVAGVSAWMYEDEEAARLCLNALKFLPTVLIWPVAAGYLGLRAVRYLQQLANS